MASTSAVGGASGGVDSRTSCADDVGSAAAGAGARGCSVTRRVTPARTQPAFVCRQPGEWRRHAAGSAAVGATSSSVAPPPHRAPPPAAG